MPLWKKVKIVDPGKATMESTTRKEFTLFLAFAFTEMKIKISTTSLLLS
jgi:hypothetical protein